MSEAAFTNVPRQVEELLEKCGTTSRRNFLKTSGLLVVSLSASPLVAMAGSQAAAPQAGGPYPDPDFRQLDSWIVIHEDNTATFYVGKTDLGQGTGTAFRQLMSDELDMPFDKTTCIMGVTDLTVDQGGSGGSDAIQVDGWPMRRVAAEARRVLLDMASKRFGVPADQLSISEAVIMVKADPSKKVTYGELIGGYFQTHPAIQKVKLHVEDPNHPAGKPFKEGEDFEDEWYIFRPAPYSRDNLHIILSIDKDSFKPNQERKDGDYAVSWCHEVGKGRVFYTSMGHRRETWRDPRFQESLIGGLKWALRQAEGDSTPSGKPGK